MSYLIATGHVLGCIVSLVCFWFFVLYVQQKTEKGRLERQNAEIALSLGVTIDDLSRPEMNDKALEMLTSKYSSELFKNRISDFGGVLFTIWQWLGSISQLIIFFTVLWKMYSDSLEMAVLIWSIPAISVLFYILGLLFSFVCKVITGRYPGEANRARVMLIEWVNSH